MNKSILHQKPSAPSAVLARAWAVAGLAPSTRLVLLWLATIADEHGRGAYLQGSLGGGCRLSSHEVGAAIKWLTRRRLLRVERGADVCALLVPAAPPGSVVYSLLLPESPSGD